MTTGRTPEELELLRQRLVEGRGPDQPRVSVCCGTGCRVQGSVDVIEAFRRELDGRRLNGDIGLVGTGCHGFCEKGPVVVLKPSGVFYQRVGVDDVPEIVSETVLNSAVIDELTYTDPMTGRRITYERDVPFYQRQQRLVLDLNGALHPTNIQDYILFGGYSALCKALYQRSPEEVIEEVTRSALRGRGGAGFRAGMKWRLCREPKEEVRYILCHAD